MADTKISAESDAGTLTGAEIVPVVRGTGSPPSYSNLRTTDLEIAMLTGLYSLAAGVPTIASMTAVNISGTTSSGQNSGKAFSVIDTGGNVTNLRGYRRTSVPSTPYLIAIGFLAVGSSLSQTTFGWSDGTKYETLGFSLGAAPASTIETWNNSTSRNGFTTGPNYGFGPGPRWIGLHDDGTNRIFKISADGANFITVNSTAKASAWLGSSGHTSIFMGIRPADTNPGIVTVICYDEAGLSRITRG